MKNRLTGISLMLLSLLVFSEVNRPGTIQQISSEIQRIAKAKNR